MAKFYSKSPLGFHDDAVHAPPNGAIPLTDDAYATLFAAQKAGRTIIIGPNGEPTAVAIEPPPPPATVKLTKAELHARIEALRAQVEALDD